MNKTAQQLLAEALVLPEHDRAELAAELFDSLNSAVDLDCEALWETEISSRVAELDNGSVQSIPWEDVKRRLFGSDGKSPS
jgi:putative addiction module component (TIGR02574 family)